MKDWMSAIFVLILGFGLTLFAGCSTASDAQSATSAPGHDLADTAWRLVRLQSTDGRSEVPARPSKYAIRFTANGRLQMQVDCNRGQGSWSSPARGQLRFSQLVTTRMMCPPGSLHDRFIRNLHDVRSYRLQGGRLYLVLQADGGVYEFEPGPR